MLNRSSKLLGVVLNRAIVDAKRRYYGKEMIRDKASLSISVDKKV